ncbi:hypothetical protein KM043_014764 [Ampulex compressa]|nr:hypothetical protein KM043_014764 [Ampulex compressa]
MKFGKQAKPPEDVEGGNQLTGEQALKEEIRGKRSAAPSTTCFYNAFAIQGFEGGALDAQNEIKKKIGRQGAVTAVRDRVEYRQE